MNEDLISMAIRGVLDRYCRESEIHFFENGIEITYSYMVTKTIDRLAITNIIYNAGLTKRTPKNLAAEWRVHNLAYKLHIAKRHARDVMLDYKGDTRLSVKMATKIFELFGMY